MNERSLAAYRETGMEASIKETDAAIMNRLLLPHPFNNG